ncbi:2,5-diamino-6-(ribosylamino)-4(3H)-pyrimidinone 5'-phosphate reductase [Halonotius pteroides]|uniref:2,5-diamino-6-(ribosylamino)-4(3H)-pyrimidinone 5'-phosphate reductase n=1 Tax=Halonotius pteroides TaxID=268735 RepID=A0A3A6Q5A8_9EURY|nr:2,5-diamino-6-(ribosylamino)-4(3H)-pyrimidinone 5'-phosphate reductase [Halonotius pteroides]RJX48525.1 2,5-diamino-6-(ribosylamino)-4(3H)-pyrimidinone 5'-phosphate reductase [Halonotius pteroides]
MHVVVNAAMSVDGKLASHRREQLAISGPEDFDRVDRIRAAADGVIVGVGTVVADDPHLTLDVTDRRVQRQRHGRPGNPARVVADSTARTPLDARILDDEATTYLLVSEQTSEERRTKLADAGAEVIVVGDDRVDLAAGIDRLADEGIERLMIEGGGELIFSAFDAGLVDELSVFVGSQLIGGRDAPTLADGDGFTEEFPVLTLDDIEQLDDGVVLKYTVEA